MLSLQFSIAYPISIHIKKPVAISSSIAHCTAPKRIRNNGITTHFSPNHCSPALRFRLAAEASRIEFEKSSDEIQLPDGLEPELMPKHVAFMLEGNRRWASNKGLSIDHGFKAGMDVTKDLVINCSKLGVKVLTAFAYSTENFQRAKEDNDTFMTSFEDMTKLFYKKDLGSDLDLRVSFIGNKSKLSTFSQSAISFLEEFTKDNKGMHLRFLFIYSGRYDIAQANKRIAEKVKDGVLCRLKISMRPYLSSILKQVALIFHIPMC